MAKFKVKDGKGKAHVSYKQKGKDGKLKMKMVSVILEKANVAQLSELFELGHPFVVAEQPDKVKVK